MEISRTVFLAWMGAMAATPACYADAPPAQPPPPRPVVYQQYAPPPYSARPRPGGTRYYYINSEGQRVAARVVYRRRVPPVGGASSDPTYRPAPPSLGAPSIGAPSSEGPSTATAAVAPEALTQSPASPAEGEGCLDSSPMSVPECSNLRLEPGCAIRSFVLEKCNTYRETLDPSVATVAVDCMERMSTRQLCDAANTYDCGKKALAEACPDTELAQLCAIAATSCNTTASDCTALLSGLNDGAKQQVARCISTGCHAGLYSCVEGLTSSSDGGKH